MDFDFTPEQDALRDSLDRWVERSFAFDRRHRIARDGGQTRAVYGELAELGITGLLVGDDHGGLGLGAVDAMVVMEALGRGLVNAPYAQGALIAPSVIACAPADAQAEWLPRIADGSALVVLASVEPQSRYRFADIRTTATRQGDEWRLEGSKGVVPAADEADAFIVPAVAEGRLSLFMCKPESAQIRAYPTQDGGRAGELALRGAAASLLVEDGLPVLERAIDVGIAATCAEAVGLMDKLMALTVDYMNTRQQFGVAISSFQALRHRIADVKMHLELGRSMSYYASLKLGEPRQERQLALSRAKLQLGQSMRFVAQQCLQLHGGIGMTDEYVGSHYVKRLTMLEMAFGDSLHHLAQVSDSLV